MNKNYQYTIIIPHFNIPNLLKRCLYSIPRREDTQVIVVDDQSNDDSVKQLKVLESDFPNVEFVYSSTNGGGGKARNIGLKYAKGKYLLFADADDCFNYCVNDILDEYQNETSDVVFFNANSIDADTYLSSDRLTTLKSVLIVYNKTHDMTLFRYLFGEPWCKLIKHDLISENNIFFEELPVHNDTKFSYLVGYYAKEVKFDNRALYCLIDRPNSVSKQIDKRQQLRVRVFSEKNAFLKSHGIPLFDYLLLNPFQYYMKRLDFRNLSLCFSTAKEYGISRTMILKRLVKRHYRAIIFGEIN